MDLERLSGVITSRAAGRARFIVGIVGPPGSGKSTVADGLAGRLDRSRVVPMDGYHLEHAELERLGRVDRKGAPDTFDAESFVRSLAELRRQPSDETIRLPAFDREIEDPVPDAIAIEPGDRVLLVEGNYLLLDAEPWRRIRPLLDLSVYVEVDPGVRIRRLIERHVAFGKSRSHATEFVYRSDEANTALIEDTRSAADVVLDG